ncbi:MAG: sensor histidine kinase [Blautia sp.]|nr:sensor histidine kinase [Blautia sp.]
MEPILYTTFLLVLFVLPFALWDLRRTYQKCKRLNAAQTNLPVTPDLGAADTLLEKGYQRVIKEILQAWQNERAESRKINAERDDYYTLWTHQIKTPIYSMDLMLQTGDTSPSKWKTELLQISSYIEMALKYLQLENQYSDLCLEQVELLPLAQEAIKKHSVILIAKRLKMDLHDLNHTVLTDRKWLLFILEQLISNAAKYTEQGSIAIYQPTSSQICVSDTGIGIATEDLPQLFEKGYTGFNGRIHQKSTGCGLYMCKKVSLLLGYKITVSSQVNKGTTVTINLPADNFSVAD